MRDHTSLALRAQAERVRTVEELRAQGFSMGATWALIQQREKRKETRMARQQQAMRLKDYHGFTPEPVAHENPPRWAMVGAAAIVAAFAGIAAGVGWLVVTHGAKVLERLGG
jgi:hypothetical protein